MSANIYQTLDASSHRKDGNLSVLSAIDIFTNGTRLVPHEPVVYDQLSSNHSQVGFGNSDSSADWMDEVINEFKRGLYTYEEPRTIVLIIIYGIIFLMALGGNVLVLLVMVVNNSMRNVTNFFLLNLALSDMLVTLVCIPLTVGEIVYRPWVYGLFLCKTASYLQGVSVAASVLTITALSLDRYIAIRHPVRSRTISTTSHAKRVILGIWIISCGIMIPLLIVRTLSVQKDIITIAFCHENWPGTNSRMIYDVVLFVFIYVIPGSVVIVSYSTTGCHLITTNRNLTRTDSEVSSSVKIMAGRRRVAKMLLVLAILFALSWLPYYTIMLYTDFHNTKDASLTALSFALLLGHSHSAQNPVIYCIMNSSFKRGMFLLLKCQWSAHAVPASPLSPNTKPRGQDNDARCRSRPSSCRSNNTFTFPAKSPPNLKTWLLTEKADKPPNIELQKCSVGEGVQNSEANHLTEHGNGVMTVCEMNGTSINVINVNVIKDQEDVRATGTAV